MEVGIEPPNKFRQAWPSSRDNLTRREQCVHSYLRCARPRLRSRSETRSRLGTIRFVSKATISVVAPVTAFSRTTSNVKPPRLAWSGIAE
jgi:hypothetical protein